MNQFDKPYNGLETPTNECIMIAKNVYSAVVASFFMSRSPIKLTLLTIFDAIFKTVKILKFRPVEPKLWKICQIAQKRFEFLTEEAKDRWRGRGVWLLFDKYT